LAKDCEFAAMSNENRVKLTTSSYEHCISTVQLLSSRSKHGRAGTLHRSSECPYVGVTFHSKCIRIAIPIPPMLRTSQLTALPQPLAKLIPANVSINSYKVALRGCIPRHGRRRQISITTSSVNNCESRDTRKGFSVSLCFEQKVTFDLKC